MPCSNLNGDLAPFCTPAPNTQVSPGDRLIIRWDSAFFENSTALVQIQAEYSPKTGASTPDDGAGFTSNYLRAGTGSYGWDVNQAALSGGADPVDAQLYIAMADEEGNLGDRHMGPLVRVVPTGFDGAAQTGESGPNLVAIVVPVVVGLLLLAGIGGYLLARRRNPGWGIRSLFRRSGSGSGQSKGQGPAATVVGLGALSGIGGGVQMADKSTDNPINGRNVFREEIRRQEEARI